MSIKSVFKAAVLASLMATGASAAIFDETQQQSITSDGQAFNFSFSPVLPSSGIGGQLYVTLSGDYSTRSYPPLSEGSTLTLEATGGFADLYNDSSSGASVGFNSISGLSLNSSAKSGGGNDVTLDFAFDLSASLLDSLLSDGIFGVSLANASDVNGSFGGFVSVRLNYEEGLGVAPIPLPASMPLIIAALGSLGFVARRKRKTL